jgi:hypothetical protein
MKTQLISLIAVASLLAMAAPASADTDSKIPAPCPGGITVNRVQDCANYAIDLAQYEVEYVLVVVCNIACDFASGEIVSADGSAATVAACGDITVNGVQDCANYAIDLAQYEVEYVLVTVCNIACDFAALSESANAGTIAFCSGPATVNGVQQCVNDVIDYGQYLVEWTIITVCNVACDFATPADVAAGSSASATSLACGDLTVNGVQDCANYGIDYGQYLVEWTLVTVCNVACDFAEVNRLSADVAAFCSGPITVNGVQQCVNDVIDYGQYLVEWTLILVCDIACDFATPGVAASAAAGELACGDVTVNGVQDCANYAIDLGQAYVDYALSVCGTTVNGIQRCVNDVIDYAQYLVEVVLVLVCDIACNLVSIEGIARAD